MTAFAIRTHKLTRDFKTVRAVDDLSLEITEGSIFGFLGPNGAGKTTTIRLLLGLLEPTAGTAEVLGYDTRKQPEAIRERCGALLEHTGLYERLSALDNLEFYGRVWHISSSERALRIEELLSHFGLWERRAETVSTWSRGMKQKLAVARALLHRPALIFLDEPTAGLDPVAAAALRDDLAALAAREGVTVFLTTHNLTEAEKLCSRVAVIRAGKLLSVGHPQQLRSGEGKLMVTGTGFNVNLLTILRGNPEVVSAELEDTHLSLVLKEGVQTASFVNLLVANGVQIEEVRRQHASLEDAFLSLVEEEQQ